MRIRGRHLAYCTNIHPAETWEETRAMLAREPLAVRDELMAKGLLRSDEPWAIGLRLSAVAAAELADPAKTAAFADWLCATNTYVFTINGFPYGGFHNSPVKTRAFAPDWSSPIRSEYTKRLFGILTRLPNLPDSCSVSTLPGSHKHFDTDSDAVVARLVAMAEWLEAMSDQCGRDLHLGLEPEPFGLFENTTETIAFFNRLCNASRDPDLLRRRIGVNYDCCHFALQFEDACSSLDAFRDAGIRLSKIHISNAISLDPRDPAALAAIRPFDEPVWSHQVVASGPAGLARFADLPEFVSQPDPEEFHEARVHFHIPLDAGPAPPLGSTIDHARATLEWCERHPRSCQHFEIETYTWAVLPPEWKRPVVDQIAAEYSWTLRQGRSST